MSQKAATASLPDAQKTDSFVAGLPLGLVEQQTLLDSLSAQVGNSVHDASVENGQHPFISATSVETNRANLACKISRAAFQEEKQYVDSTTDDEYYSQRTQIIGRKPASSRSYLYSSLGAFYSVRSGSHWPDFYGFLDSRGLTDIGQRQGTVGVARLILGGGLSYLFNKEGLPCDNVILADSISVSANTHENPDLFFVLKGGGSNFGIVSRFDLYTKLYNQIYFEIAQYDLSEIELLLEALVEAQHDPNVGLIFTVSPQSTIVGFVYLESTLRPDVFSRFYTISDATTLVPVTIGTHGQLVHAVVSLMDPSLKAKRAQYAYNSPRHDAVVASTDADINLYTEMYHHGCEESKTLSGKTDASVLLVYQQMSKETVTRDEEMGHNAFEMTAQTQSWFTATATWQNDVHDKTVHEAIDRIGAEVARMATSKGLSRPQLFPNDATFFQDPVGSFGTKNFDNLRAASLKYDPEQTFQKLQYGGFKLGLA